MQFSTEMITGYNAVMWRSKDEKGTIVKDIILRHDDVCFKCTTNEYGLKNLFRNVKEMENDKKDAQKKGASPRSMCSDIWNSNGVANLNLGVVYASNPNDENGRVSMFGHFCPMRAVAKTFAEEFKGQNFIYVNNVTAYSHASLELKARSDNQCSDYYNLIRSEWSMYEEKMENKEISRSYTRALIIPFDYVKTIPKKVNTPYGITIVHDIEYYRKGKLVFLAVQGKRDDGLYDVEYKYPKTGKTFKTLQYEKENTEIPVMEDWGCIDCPKCEYHITKGGVFLKCTECGKEVLEKEYTGEEYPEYCERPIAKKIRKAVGLVSA